jgi:UDP-3-O-acyl N-acetylglucosamine deacetylase
MVEHLLATCHMYGITNLLVKISDEVPIFDGSAQEICSKIEEAGIIEQNQGIEPLVIKKKIVLPNLPDGKYLSIEPAGELEIDYRLEQPRPIGVQQYVFRGGKSAFLREIAPARTFGSIKDFERLEKMGLAAGSRVSSVMSNVILLNNDEVINTELRFADEFVRHKILDLIGDLYLITRPVIGRVVARQTGHLENIALVKELKQAFCR